MKTILKAVSVAVFIFSFAIMETRGALTSDNTAVIDDFYASGRGAADYEDIYGSIFDDLEDDGAYGQYLLCDIDKNGVCELIIRHGAAGKDYMTDIWRLDDSGSVLPACSLTGENAFYIAPDGNGIYAVGTYYDYEIVRKITLNEEEFQKRVVAVKDKIEEDNDSERLEIVSADIRDRGLLERWSISD